VAELGAWADDHDILGRGQWQVGGVHHGGRYRSIGGVPDGADADVAWLKQRQPVGFRVCPLADAAEVELPGAGDDPAVDHGYPGVAARQQVPVVDRVQAGGQVGDLFERLQCTQAGKFFASLQDLRVVTLKQQRRVRR
jgi:hypothetical protein